MSEETNTEVKPVKASWYNRIWAALTGLVVGIAAMFGVSQTQLTTVKNDATDAYKQIQIMIDAVKNKDYATAIEAGKTAVTKLQAITGEVKEISGVVKEAGDEYKESVLGIKAAIEAKDYAKASADCGTLIAKITANIPADKLTGKTKQIYDFVVLIKTNIDEKKYDATLETIKSLVDLFKKAEEAAPAAATAAAAVEAGK